MLQIGPLCLEDALRGLLLTWQGQVVPPGSTPDSLRLPPVADLSVVAVQLVSACGRHTASLLCDSSDNCSDCEHV